MEYRFELPVPPTGNHNYSTSNTGARFKSKKHVVWQKSAMLMIKKIPNPMTGSIEAIYTFHFATSHRRDLANFEKLLTDTLVKAGIIKDDSLIDRMVLNRGKDKTGNVVGIIRLLSQ
jgi:Holliday junction resolvase RusA-like endonuclease